MKNPGLKPALGLALASAFVVGQKLTPAANAAVAAPAIRIVACDARVQSHKRGICANRLEPADFLALSPGVSWSYNWFYQPNGNPPAGIQMDFVPMVWGDRAADLAGLESYLAAGHKPRQILAVNEPNLRGQAFITPQQTANLYARVKAIADKYGIPVSGPQMAIGSSSNDSIKAMDPLENKEVTYSFMVPFIKAFLAYSPGTPVPSLGFHSYGNMGEMRWAVGMMHKEFARRLWVTEYAQWSAPDVNAARTYLIQATDLLERSDFVDGYAWFKERSDNPKISLLEKEPGKLSPLGEAYVALPVHDVDIYYRIPGRLQAENYVRLDNMEIWPTDDANGFTHMAANEPGGATEYNLQVDRAGTYTLRLRASVAGSITVLQGDAALATVAVPDGGEKWQTVSTTVKLAAGPRTLTLRCAVKNQAINWLEFAAP